jgi:hypothetical protein
VVHQVGFFRSRRQVFQIPEGSWNCHVAQVFAIRVLS